MSDHEASRARVDPLEATVSATDRALRSAEERVHDRLFGPPAVPERAGKYVIRRRVGQGAMGVVYAGYDPMLDRKVAIKFIDEPKASSPVARERMLREAQAMARLSHPNVVHVYEADEQDDRIFIAMEFIGGGTLREWLDEEERPDWRGILELFQQIGRGLAEAHEAGVVHRDFKPDNVLLTRKGRPKVADFGLAGIAQAMPTPDLASLASAEGSLTATGSVLGTPRYMSLEQFNGKRADARSDQFSFCATLYEALYGEHPFEGDSLEAVVISMVEGKVRPAPSGTKVPAAVRKVLLRGLANEPEDRWPSMDALLGALADQTVRRTRRWVVLGATLTLALLTTAFGLVGYAAMKTKPDLGLDQVDEINTQTSAASLYEQGKKAYRLGHFDQALVHWEKAYQLSDRTLLLYNLSMAYEGRFGVSGDVEDLRSARATMKNFLAIADPDPDLEPGDAVERIARLDDVIARLEAGEPVSSIDAP